MRRKMFRSYAFGGCISFQRTDARSETELARERREEERFGFNSYKGNGSAALNSLNRLNS